MGKETLLKVASVDSVRQTKRELQLELAKLIYHIPDLWEITTYKSSDRPPEQAFKALNKLIGKEAYGATEEEAKNNAAWRS